MISKSLAGKEFGERQRCIMFGNASVYSSAKNDRPVGPKYSHNAYKIYFFAAEVLTLG